MTVRITERQDGRNAGRVSALPTEGGGCALVLVLVLPTFASVACLAGWVIA